MIRDEPPFLGLSRLADDGREVQFLFGQAFEGALGDRTEAIGAHVLDDSILNLVLVREAGVHVAEELLQQRRGEDFADHVEHLIRAKFAADFTKAVEQLLQNPAFAGVLGHEVDDEAVVFLAVTVNSADPLFEPDGIPGDVVVDHQPAELQVNAFAGGFRGDQNLSGLLEFAFGVSRSPILAGNRLGPCRDRRATTRGRTCRSRGRSTAA